MKDLLVIHNPDSDGSTGRSGIYASETVDGNSNPRIVNATLVGRDSESIPSASDADANEFGILFADNHRRADLKGAYSGVAQFWAPNHVPFKGNAPNYKPNYARMMPYMDKTHLARIATTSFDGSGKILSLKYASEWPGHSRITGKWD